MKSVTNTHPFNRQSKIVNRKSLHGLGRNWRPLVIAPSAFVHCWVVAFQVGLAWADQATVTVARPVVMRVPGGVKFRTAESRFGDCEVSVEPSSVSLFQLTMMVEAPEPTEYWMACPAKVLKKSSEFVDEAVRRLQATAFKTFAAAACSLAFFTDFKPTGKSPRTAIKAKDATPMARVTSTSEKAEDVKR